MESLKALQQRLARLVQSTTPPARRPYIKTSPEIREELRGMMRTDLQAGLLPEVLEWLFSDGLCEPENIRQLFHGQRNEAEVLAVVEQVAPSAPSERN